MTEQDTDPVVLVSALEHHLYCRRQAALIHRDGVWQDNRHTVRGRIGHRRADHGADRRERGVTVLRGVRIFSERHSLTGRCDAIELGGDGTVTPVEYKIGRRHGRAADVQVCAQALCLEEMFETSIAEAAVWYSGPRRRVRVILDDDLRSATLVAIEQHRADLLANVLPLAPADERCEECQLAGYCMPHVVARANDVADYVDRLSCD